ncbi:MAG: DUF362 domain-containing protein [Candidatus Atabeyarchaeum deiterrae]
MAKVKVSITRSEDPERSILRGIKLIGGIDDLDRPGYQVIIKPGIFDPSRPPYTEVKIAEATATLFHKTKDISFAESDNHLRTGIEALKTVGYDRIIRTGLVNLSSNLTQHKRTRLTLLKQQTFSKILLNTDVLVNLATMKTEKKVGRISIGVNNLFGLIPDRMKSRFHPDLDDVLLELLKIIKPSLTIVDATKVYLGSYPSYKSVDAGLIIAGRDVIAVDAVCCKILGINPSSVRYLSLAAGARKGTMDLNEIDVLGLKLTEARELFLSGEKKPN